MSSEAGKPAPPGGSLPLVLVVDDELGLPEHLYAVGNRDATAWAESLSARRQELCAEFGLVEIGKSEREGRAVARVKFVAGLRVESGGMATPDPQLIVSELDRLSTEGRPGAALVLLDQQFGFGKFDWKKRRMTSTHPRFGSEVALPALAKRYGYDLASSTHGWVALPVVIFSSLPKLDNDEAARGMGARGMIEKHSHGGPESARSTLGGYLRAHGLLRDPDGELIGSSIAFLNSLAAARRAAVGPGSVSIAGEAGTGKELLARYIHRHSGRPRERYAIFHAAGRGDELQEDELFGHQAGAFTGAVRDAPGLIEESDGGSLLIDEIGDVTPRVQNSLMRPLQERRVSRVGRRSGSRTTSQAIDVKFIFATNKDLDALAAAGRFKPDLLERIRQVTITLPPLRERPGDVEELVPALLHRIDAESGLPSHSLDPRAMQVLTSRRFDGANVRELRNVLVRAALDHPYEARLTAVDFKTAEASKREPETGAAGEALRAIGGSARALARWKEADRERLTLAELRSLHAELRGAATDFIVTLLEVACDASRADGKPTLQRILGFFWGVDPQEVSAQEARRGLARILRADWDGLSVAERASRSQVLMGLPVVRRTIERALSKA